MYYQSHFFSRLSNAHHKKKNSPAVHRSFHYQYKKMKPIQLNPEKPFKGFFCLITIVFILTTLKSEGQTTYTWTGSTSGAWLTINNWSPAGSPSLSTHIAFFNNNTQPTDGINMNTLGGSMTIAAVHFSTSATTGRTINNSSGTVSGTLTLLGTTINSISNTIIRNLSTGNHTITNGSTTNLGIGLANTTNNVISLDGTGNLVITSTLSTTGAISTPLFIRGNNSGATLTFNSTANTFTGDITVNGDGLAPANAPEFVIVADGSLGNSVNNVILDGGRLTGSGTFTIASGRSIKTSSVSGSSISSKGSSSVLTYNGSIINFGSGGGSWSKQGAGKLILGGSSNYSGATSVNNGTLQLASGNDRLPTTTTLNMGQTASANTGTFDLNGFSQQLSGVNSIIGNATTSKNTITSSGSSSLTINATNNFTYGSGTNTNSGIITGAITIIKAGSGIQTLGDANTFSGKTILNAGELRITPLGSVTAVNISSSALILNGGTLGTSGINNNSSVTYSTMALTDNSIIDLSTTNSHTLNFANSSAVSWTASKTLTITGWQGVFSTSSGTTGTKGRVFIGSNATSLTSAQLSQIRFFDSVNYYGAILLSTGELSPYCVAPVISFTGNNSPICEGSALTLSCTAIGTLTPAFSWSGPNSFASTAQNPTITAATTAAAGVYTVTATNVCGVTSQTTTPVVINNTVIPTVTISASPSTTVCSGSTVTFSASSTNGGGSPSYQWFLNGGNVGSNSSSYINNSFSNNDKIYVTLTSNALCPFPASANSNTIALTIKAQPTVSAVADQTVCAGKPFSSIAFTSTPTGATFFWSNTNTNIGLGASGVGNISSYITPFVTTDELGAISVLGSLSGCIGSQTTFNLIVRGPQASSVWTGAVSTSWFDPDNWSNCICGKITNATITPTSNQPLISGSLTAETRDLTLSTSSTLSIQSTQTLSIYGNWDNNGTFIAQQGLVNLNSTAITQTLGGTSPTTFYDLSLNNANGTVLTTAQNITGSLLLNSGTFNTNNMLTLSATSSGAGRIAAINPAADLINNVTVEQEAPGPNAGWALLGMPMSSSKQMSDWNDDFVITCLTCPDGCFNFTSVYSYDETAAGSYSASAKYIPINNITDNINPGTGYWVYLGNTTNNSINFDVTGTVAKSSCLTCTGPVTIPLSFTSNSGPTDDGWNLIANPLPSPISWTALRNNNVNVDNAIYAYNTDLSSGSGAFTSYVNGVSSDLSGGIGDNIPMCQAVYVHATAATTLTASESIKTKSNQAFLKTNSVSSTKPMVHLLMNSSTGYSDITAFYFEAGATTAFQKDYDAYKLINDPSFPYLGSISSSQFISINGLPPLTSNISVPVKAITAVTSPFTFSLIPTNFPTGICVNLFDNYTGITTNLLSGTYSCTLFDTTTSARFSINFTSLPLAGSATATQPNCTSPSSGLITGKGNNAGPWDFEWKDATNTIVKNSINRPVADSLVYLSGGIYTLRINTSGQCDNFSQTFTITNIIQPVAGFSTSADTVYLSSSGYISTTNLSTGGSAFNWDFGDMTGSVTGFSPVHTYSIGGIFPIRLTVQSISGCLDSISKNIVVMNNLSGITTISNNNHVIELLSTGESGFLIHMIFPVTENVYVRLYDLTGKLISEDKLYSIETTNYPLNLNKLNESMFLIEIRTESGISKTFKLLNNR